MVRSIVGWMFVCVTSVGTLARVIDTRFVSGTVFFRMGLVIGILSRVSIDLMSDSVYCTPTKYWLPLTLSIQKFFLLNWMLELTAEMMFIITSRWFRPRSAALARSTLMMYSG